MRRCLEGDRSAFDDIVRLHSPRVWRISRRLLIDPDMAEDVAQETFVRAWRYLRSFDQSRRLDAWLAGITVRQCRKANARLARRREAASRAAREAKGDATTPRGRIERAEMVERALGLLPLGQREVVVLRYLEGYSAVEIATGLGLRAGTVRKRLYDARRSLRELLSEEIR